MKHIGLFEGIGGFSLAARWAGWETPVMVEWNPYCQAVLRKNFPDATIFGDIRKFDGTPYRGQFDILTGGFPCQPYSHAGKRAGNDDERALWPEMLRVIREVAPTWVVGENVAGLLSMDGGRVLGGILSDLENAGYSPEIYSIPAIGVGAPHQRERIWIVAHCDGGNRTLSISPQSGWDKNKDINPSGQNSGAVADAGRGNGENWRHGETEKKIRQANEHRNATNGYHWAEHWFQVATRLCRVDDGLPAGVDGTGEIPVKTKTKKAAGKSHRLEALGNAIVPHIAYEIFEAINQYKKITWCASQNGRQ